MKCSLYLQTKYGFDLYNIVLKQYNEVVKNGLQTIFKESLIREKSIVDKALSEFIYNADTQKKYKMDETDEEGWVIYKELADKYTVINHFERKIG